MDRLDAEEVRGSKPLVPTILDLRVKKVGQ